MIEQLVEGCIVDMRVTRGRLHRLQLVVSMTTMLQLVIPGCKDWDREEER